jgi:hypothetical protein
VVAFNELMDSSLMSLIKLIESQNSLNYIFKITMPTSPASIREEDFPRRVNFCQWLLNQDANNPYFFGTFFSLTNVHFLVKACLIITIGTFEQMGIPTLLEFELIKKDFALSCELELSTITWYISVPARD